MTTLEPLLQPPAENFAGPAPWVRRLFAFMTCSTTAACVMAMQNFHPAAQQPLQFLSTNQSLANATGQLGGSIVEQHPAEFGALALGGICLLCVCVRMKQNQSAKKSHGKVLGYVGQVRRENFGGSGGPAGDHVATLNRYVEANREKFQRCHDEVARTNWAKMVEIDEKGTSYIDESDLVELCESLASLFDEKEPGLAKKLETEIRLQKTKFETGTLQPILKTSIVGVDTAGAFSIVQVCATWNKTDITVNYSQMGRSWSTPPGQPGPPIEVMKDYYQYKTVGAMLELLGDDAPRAATR